MDVFLTKLLSAWCGNVVIKIWVGFSKLRVFCFLVLVLFFPHWCRDNRNLHYFEVKSPKTVSFAAKPPFMLRWSVTIVSYLTQSQTRPYKKTEHFFYQSPSGIPPPATVLLTPMARRSVSGAGQDNDHPAYPAGRPPGANGGRRAANGHGTRPLLPCRV